MIGMARYPNKYFDLAVVDPPYGLGLDMVLGVDPNKRKYKKIHKAKEWNDAVPGPEYFEELHRISKHQIIWGCNYYAKWIPAVGRIIHDKIMGTEETAFNWSHADIASCSMFSRIVMWRYQWAGNKQNGKINWDNSGLDSRIHPTQKPVSLYSWIYSKYLPEGGKVIDTHLGSGSNRIAAHKAGNIDFTAYEIDKEYFEAQEKRFRNYTSQLVMQF